MCWVTQCKLFSQPLKVPISSPNFIVHRREKFTSTALYINQNSDQSDIIDAVTALHQVAIMN